MLRPNNSSQLGTVLGLALAWLITNPVAARAQEPRWTFRVVGFGSNTSRVDRDDRYWLHSSELEGTPGAAVSAELRTGRRLGLELSGLWSHLDHRLTTEYVAPRPPARFEEKRTVSLQIVTLGLPIHLTPDRRMDLSIAPIAGIALYGSEPFIESQEQPAYGLALGLDWPIGSRGLALSGSVRVVEAHEEAFARQFAVGVRERWILMRFYGLGLSYRR